MTATFSPRNALALIAAALAHLVAFAVVLT